MNITDAKYYNDLSGENQIGIYATINGVRMAVPLEPANSDCAEIMRKVEAGELTIAEAD